MVDSDKTGGGPDGLRVELKRRLNLRELGGLPAADGKRIKPGHLYRSGELTDLSEEEFRLLESLGLAFICDLRTADKGVEVPTPRIGETPYVQLPVFGGNFSSSEIPKLLGQMAAGGKLEDPLPGIYRQFVTDEHTRGAYARLVRALLEAEGRPVLWHCTVGKDRTGFAAAVVLLALGASEETIAADYMATEGSRAEATERILAQVGAVLPDERVLGFVRSVLGVSLDYIRSALDEMRSAYGSTDGYLEQGLGVTEQERMLLRERYLE
ncbi:tyrosine-protein phosphatase [Paenibacillus albicereus]|uniref:Tyrosine-protein phosphatase n=1 Tax=Paenibacillus albicereus TaxID=2726185 RepID=A0A6H2H2T8_9BACL|nr:tyrosine-protein phosphatase [Paenibacillus albicereus]QJC54013.1 tyrosine-protein phosphatase [Paenibacillus albicereus]